MDSWHSQVTEQQTRQFVNYQVGLWATHFDSCSAFSIGIPLAAHTNLSRLAGSKRLSNAGRMRIGVGFGMMLGGMTLPI